MARRIVMLGAPASGKGTQSARLAAHFHLPKLSTGALIRAEQQGGSKLGRLADQFLAGGGFLPDELMVEIMTGWLADHGNEGFVLDGFPRTVPQAIEFDSILADNGHRLDAVVLLEVDLGTLHRRIANRVHCKVCGGTFQLDAGGIAPGKPCPQAGCDGQLAPRGDDQPEPYAGRLANYRKLTEPLIQHYQTQAVLKRVDGNAAPGEVSTAILEQLGTRTSPQLK